MLKSVIFKHLTKKKKTRIYPASSLLLYEAALLHSLSVLHPGEKKESKASKWGVDVSDAHRRYAAKVWQRKESSYHPPSRRKRLSRTRPHPRTHREHMVVLSYLENASNAVDVNNTWQVNGSSLCLVSLINKKICLFLQLISCALLRQQMHLEMRRLQILLLVFSVHSVSRP